MLFAHLGKFLCVDEGMEWQESFAEACREGWRWLSDSLLGSCYLGCVTADEVVHCLFALKLGYGWHDSESIACEENNILGMSADGWKLHILDVLKRVDDTRILSLRDIVIVDRSLHALILMVDSVLDDRTESDGVINIGLFLS